MQPTEPPEPPESSESPQNPRGQRAAWLVAALGLVELAALVPMLMLCLLLIWPSDSFRRQVEPRLTPGQWAWARGTAPRAAGLLTALGVLPGAGLVMLAPLVRRQRRAAVLLVRFLLLVQMIELVWLTVQRAPDAAQSLRDGQPVHVTVNLLAVGTPMALVGYAFCRLGGLGEASGRAGR